MTENKSKTAVAKPAATKRGRKPLDTAAYAVKQPTGYHKSMAEWLTAETGVEVSAKAVQVVTGLQGRFRASDAGKAASAERVNAGAVARAARRQAKIAAVEARLAALKAKEKETE